MSVKTPENMHVVVLAGGFSSESEISAASGKNAAAALKEAGYAQVDIMDPVEEGFVQKLATGGYDVAFIALHGAFGEDGTVQGLLEALKIPYTGSDVIASASGADKDLAKLLYQQRGIPVSPSVTLHVGDIENGMQSIDGIVEKLGETLFVKPAVNGSSYGISSVKKKEELQKAIDLAFEYSNKVLVEKRVYGTEITVGVFGGKDPVALPIVEIRKPENSDFYDLEVKYSDPSDIHRIPAQIPEDFYVQAQKLAVEAHKALGCLGISRTDFIVSDGGPIILETNTIPGMTDTSLYPDEVRHTDMTFPQVCDELVQLALERAEA